MQYAKRAVVTAQDEDEQTVLAMARDYAAQLSVSADLAEGVRSFLERRSPLFRDGIDRKG